MVKFVRGISAFLMILLMAGFVSVAQPTTARADDIPNREVAQEVYQRVIGLGGTKEAAAAVTANVWQESGFRPEVVNSIGAAGLFQWLNARRTNMEASATEKGVKWTSVKHQVEFAIRDEPATGDPFQGSYTIEGKYCNSGHSTNPATCDGVRLGGIKGGVKEYLKGTNRSGMVVEFTGYWERPGSGEAHVNTRIAHAETIYNAFKDLPGLTPEDKEVSAGKGGEDEEGKDEDVDVSQGGTGLLSEEDLEGMPEQPKWEGAQEIEEATIDDLSLAEQQYVAQAKDNIALHAQGIVQSLTIFVTMLGLIIMMWGLLLLVGGTFDRVNNFVELNMTKILTFGNMEYVHDEDQRGKSRVGLAGVAVRAGVCFGIGALIVSGVISGLVLSITLWTQGLL